MTNFECCKTKAFPSSYHICVNCFKVFHRSCVMKQKSKFNFIEGFQLRCCNTEDNIKQSEEEKSILEETISELSENTHLQERYITKLKAEHEKIIEEATQREEESDNIIQQQKDLLEEANKEIISLKEYIKKFTTKICIHKSTQTHRLSVSERQVQTIQSTDYPQEVTSVKTMITVLPESDKTDNIGKSEIILIAGKQGRGLVHHLRYHMKNCNINSILKPNAGNNELVKTTISASKHLTKRDFIVIWPNENFTHYFEYLHSSLRHTNFLILSTPYDRRNPYFNERVYYGNLALYRKSHSLTGGLSNLIDTNSVLMKNYSLARYPFAKTAIRCIGKSIAEKILKINNEASLERTYVSQSNQSVIQNISRNRNEEASCLNFLFPHMDLEIHR